MKPAFGLAILAAVYRRHVGVIRLLLLIVAEQVVPEVGSAVGDRVPQVLAHCQGVVKAGHGPVAVLVGFADRVAIMADTAVYVAVVVAAQVDIGITGAEINAAVTVAVGIAVPLTFFWLKESKQRKARRGDFHPGNQAAVVCGDLLSPGQFSTHVWRISNPVRSARAPSIHHIAW